MMGIRASTPAAVRRGRGKVSQVDEVVFSPAPVLRLLPYLLSARPLRSGRVLPGCVCAVGSVVSASRGRAAARAVAITGRQRSQSTWPGWPPPSHGRHQPDDGRKVIDAIVVQRTLSAMVTCGMYDAAGDWVSAVGMSAKSGVGGGYRRRPARSTRNRRLIIAIERQRQQCSRNSGMPQPLRATGAAFPLCHTRIALGHPGQL